MYVQKNRTYTVKEQVIDLKYQGKNLSWKASKRNKEKRNNIANRYKG